MHSTDVKLLQECFKGAGRRSILPPATALHRPEGHPPAATAPGAGADRPVLRNKSDYTAVVKALQDSAQAFPTGTYALWYPMLAKLESRSCRTS
jgi:23S rRNA (adenine2030-N6)-methyltransferase